MTNYTFFSAIFFISIFTISILIKDRVDHYTRFQFLSHERAMGPASA